MRNIFRPSLFVHLKLGERILHSIVTAGLIVAVLDYLLLDYRDEGPLMGIVFALFGGIVFSLFLAVFEHLFLASSRKRKVQKKP